MNNRCCSSAGWRRNHKDFAAESAEGFAGLAHQTSPKNQTFYPHQLVHREKSKELEEVFQETELFDLNKQVII